MGQAFGAYPRLYIDLPGHGGSAHIAVNHFADVSELIKNTLNSYNILKYWLVGYSLGGRVAMFYVSQPREGLCGLVVEGASGPGDDNQRRLRRRSDAAWAERFRREPLTQVFADWYQQPVFASWTQRSGRHWLRYAAAITAERWRRCCRPARWRNNPICARRYGRAISLSLPLRRTRRQVSRHRR